MILNYRYDYLICIKQLSAIKSQFYSFPNVTGSDCSLKIIDKWWQNKARRVCETQMPQQIVQVLYELPNILDINLAPTPRAWDDSDMWVTLRWTYSTSLVIVWPCKHQLLQVLYNLTNVQDIDLAPSPGPWDVSNVWITLRWTNSTSLIMLSPSKLQLLHF